MMEMFCYQCQETALNKGCTLKGVCGKEPHTSALMDVLLYAVRGEAIVNRELRRKGNPEIRASRQMLDALFCTITNANFDDSAIREKIAAALTMKNELIGVAQKGASPCPTCRKRLSILRRPIMKPQRPESAC